MFKNLLEKAFDLGIQVIIALIILLIGFKIIKIIEKNLKKENKLSKIDKSVKTFLISILSISLKIILLLIAASIVGIPTTSFITLLGTAGVAIGLALQGGLSNLAGGVMILMFKPFKVGDFIETNGSIGTVKSITMFYTNLTTLDNKEIHLPNGALTNNTIINYSANPERRLDLEFNVSYDSEIDKVKKVINDVIKESKYALKDKTHVVNLRKHADSSLTFDAKIWIDGNTYWDALYYFEEEIKKAFDKNNIEIPYPQLDIHQK